MLKFEEHLQDALFDSVRPANLMVRLNAWS